MEDFENKLSDILKKELEDNVLQNELITLLSKQGEAHKGFLLKHLLGVQKYACLLTNKLGLGKSTYKITSLGALFHDFGKIFWVSTLSEGKGALSEEDWNIIKEHPLRGYNLLNSLDIEEDIKYIALLHHLKFGGGGYPENAIYKNAPVSNLTGKEIPLSARICSLADAYDAMTNTRPYRRTISSEFAIQELLRCSGQKYDKTIRRPCGELIKQEYDSQFDPDLVKIFITTNPAKL